MRTLIATAVALAAVFALHGMVGTAAVKPTPFGKLPDGRAVDVFAFGNGRGLDVRVMSYGATLISVRTPDRAGSVDDVVLGLDSIEEYLTKGRFFGSVVGRYANRIANARFAIDGHTYQLAANSGGVNHIHGGLVGFDKKVWTGEPFERDGNSGVRFTTTSADGEEGYPGAMRVAVTYTVTPRNELMLEYEATTDKITVLNLTNHTYFNLAGRGHGDVLQHRVTINADRYTPADAALIPTGEIAPVAGTPFDFRQPTAIGARIDADNEQLRNGKGYDHNYVLNGSGLRLAARVVEPASGRTMQVDTDQPGVQFYTGNYLDSTNVGKSGKPYAFRNGFCMETQHFPDSPNQPNFPSTVLKPGQLYQTASEYKFQVVK